MNRGIEELKGHVNKYAKIKAKKDFKRICDNYLKRNKVKPLQPIKANAPYLIMKIKLEDFKKLFKKVGSIPWGVIGCNWGHDFYCIKAKFDWKSDSVLCKLQSENEHLNMQRTKPIRFIDCREM